MKTSLEIKFEVIKLIMADYNEILINKVVTKIEQ